MVEKLDNFLIHDPQSIFTIKKLYPFVKSFAYPFLDISLTCFCEVINFSFARRYATV